MKPPRLPFSMAKIRTLLPLSSDNARHNVAVCAEWSSISYLHPGQIADVESDCPFVAPFEDYPTQGFVVASPPDWGAIVFTGTNDEVDAMLDGWAYPLEDNGKSMHAGFYFMQKLARNAILKLDLPEVNEWVLTGHSAGGAIAECFAQHWPAEIGGSIRSIITFGAPRSQSVKTAGTFPFTGIRIVKDRDIVPDYPPFRGFKFAHVLDDRFLVGPGNLIGGRRDWGHRISRAWELGKAWTTSSWRGRKAAFRAVRRKVEKYHDHREYAAWMAPYLHEEVAV